MIDLNTYQKYRQGKWQRLLVFAILPALLFLMYLGRDSTLLSGAGGSIFSHSDNPSGLDTHMTSLLRQLYAPIIHPITAETFTYNGEVFTRKGDPIFTRPLGKRILILDVDSRDLSGEGMIMNGQPQPWSKLTPLSAGLMGHYMYAQIHGYDYKFVQAPGYDDRWGTWVKVAMIKEALKDHDFVVFMDSDAGFNNMELPLEWLLNYWNITKDVLVAMSIEPNEPQNYDNRGKLLLNTGFQITQQSERTQEMYRTWAECPLETRYPDCAKWKFDFAHEQSAFGTYLRYDFNRTDDVRSLPCREANGCPEAEGRGDSGCVGIFVRHYWQDKSLPLVNFGNALMSSIVPQLHKQFIHNRPHHIFDVRDKSLSGSELIG